MEILLIAACAWLVHTAGAQSEQSRLGVSPAQRDIMREQTRHEKAVRRIGEKHGGAAPPANGTSPWKNPPGADPKTAAPETFWSGYRAQRPTHPPLGHRAGTWAGNGVTWAQDTGREAWRAYRKRRTGEGNSDPSLIMVPFPPSHPPAVPPMPVQPPTAGTDGAKTKTAARPDEKAVAKPGEAPKTEPVADLKKTPEPTPVDPSDVEAERIRQVLERLDALDPEPDAQPASAATHSTKDQEPAVAGQGVGRMAAEVTYESVMDESDELSIMCEDDVRVYDRIRDRAEREIGRADDLMAAMENAGFGPSVIGRVARCKEQYQVIYSQVDDLQKNTIGQGEAVVKAKALLVAGQGVYADIAKDMESVAERDAYISDAVDAEDTNAHTEVYETKAA